MSTNREKASWLAGLLTGWGIRESWAKIIAGAVVGALCAAGCFAAQGCTAGAVRYADGSWCYGAAMQGAPLPAALGLGGTAIDK